jgi:hypothetical protein
MTAESSEAVRVARFELLTALEEIEALVNVPRRARRSAAELRARLVLLRDESPFVFTGLALALAGGAAAAVWGALRLIRK